MNDGDVPRDERDELGLLLQGIPHYPWNIIALCKNGLQLLINVCWKSRASSKNFLKEYNQCAKRNGKME